VIGVVSGSSGRAPMLPRLHVLTDTRPDGDVLATVDAVLDAGRPCIQVRIKDGTDRERLELATAVAERCHAAGTWCIVNDRVDIALASGADGVHLGAHDLPVVAARRLAGDRLVIGGTARDPAMARQLVEAGADYLGVGPVHATTTKTGLPDPLGTDRLAEVVGAVGVPVIAIGGVTLRRLPAVLATGAHGAAVVGAVADAIDPRGAAAALLAVVGAAEVDDPRATDTDILTDDAADDDAGDNVDGGRRTDDLAGGVAGEPSP
jgi:thiamine-phosphate pyrophosphorylase